jgi:8-oxo-dGTP pyrophosphatase MutT (NUDIX family)
VTRRGEKHWAATVYTFARVDGVWKTCMVLHRKLGKWLPPGGHVEPHENPAEAALREALEETGLTVRLVPLRAPLPVRSEPGEAVFAQPELVVEETIPPHGSVPEHYHLDALYMGLAESAVIFHDPGESDGIAWYAESEIAALNTFPLTRAFTALCFARLAEERSWRQ